MLLLLLLQLHRRPVLLQLLNLAEQLLLLKKRIGRR